MAKMCLSFNHLVHSNSMTKITTDQQNIVRCYLQDTSI